MVFLATAAAGLLLMAAGASAVPCPNETAFAWCDTALPLDRRVDLLVANLSREEKAQLFASNASAIERIGWPKYNWWYVLASARPCYWLLWVALYRHIGGDT
jgi:hypothetical protein